MLQTREQKFFIVFEAAKRSLIATEILFNRIINELKSFEEEIEKSTELGQAAAIPPLPRESLRVVTR